MQGKKKQIHCYILCNFSIPGSYYIQLILIKIRNARPQQKNTKE